MVVSVEISGILEEKLRRLVDLGIYASVSEAVRDAVRKLLSQLDLKNIAVSLILTRGASLHYACEFSDSTCGEFLEYLLIRNIQPSIGYLGNPKLPKPEELLILDSSSIYVIFSTILAKIVDKLIGILNIVVPSILEHYYLVMRAMATRRGIELKNDFKTIKIDIRRPPSKLLVTTQEYSIIEYASGLDNTKIVTDDLFIQRYLEKQGISYIASISLLDFARKSGIISDVEYSEAILSLRSLPYTMQYPSEM